MKKRKLNILQRVGLGLIICGAGIVICSVDPYSNDKLTNMDLLVRAAQAGILVASGWVLYRPWKTEEDDDYLERR